MATESEVSDTGSWAPAPPGAKQPREVEAEGFHTLKIATFCVQGLQRMLKERRGGSLAGLLEELDADIVCLQDVRMRRGRPLEDLKTATLDGLAGWGSCFAPMGGEETQAGVATFFQTARAQARWRGAGTKKKPMGAEPGLACSASTRAALERHLGREAVAEMEAEGRVMVTDHGAFLLYNVLAHSVIGDEADGPAKDKTATKLCFLEALEHAWRLEAAAGRAILVAGNFGTPPARIDCKSDKKGASFYWPERPDRLWLRQLLGGEPASDEGSERDDMQPGGGEAAGEPGPGEAGDAGDAGAEAAPPPVVFADALRELHPDQRTCTVWGKKTKESREAEKGVGRYDLVLCAGIGIGKAAALATPRAPTTPHSSGSGGPPAAAAAALVWVASCEIVPGVAGSDHAPVVAQLASAAPFPCAAEAAAAATSRRVSKGRQPRIWELMAKKPKGEGV